MNRESKHQNSTDKKGTSEEGDKSITKSRGSYKKRHKPPQSQPDHSTTVISGQPFTPPIPVSVEEDQKAENEETKTTRKDPIIKMRIKLFTSQCYREISFEYNMDLDTPEGVAKEMSEELSLSEKDIK